MLTGTRPHPNKRDICTQVLSVPSFWFGLRPPTCLTNLSDWVVFWCWKNQLGGSGHLPRGVGSDSYHTAGFCRLSLGLTSLHWQRCIGFGAAEAPLVLLRSLENKGRRFALGSSMASGSDKTQLEVFWDVRQRRTAFETDLSDRKMAAVPAISQDLCRTHAACAINPRRFRRPAANDATRPFRPTLAAEDPIERRYAEEGSG